MAPPWSAVPRSPRPDSPHAVRASATVKAAAPNLLVFLCMAVFLRPWMDSFNLYDLDVLSNQQDNEDRRSRSRIDLRQGRGAEKLPRGRPGAGSAQVHREPQG